MRTAKNLRRHSCMSKNTETKRETAGRSIETLHNASPFSQGCQLIIRRAPEDIFGGDCSRIARIRTVLDEVVLSDMNCQDQRALNLAFNSANILCFEVSTYLSCLPRSVHAQRLVIHGRSMETYSNYVQQALVLSL